DGWGQVQQAGQVGTAAHVVRIIQRETLMQSDVGLSGRRMVKQQYESCGDQQTFAVHHLGTPRDSSSQLTETSCLQLYPGGQGKWLSSHVTARLFGIFGTALPNLLAKLTKSM